MTALEAEELRLLEVVQRRNRVRSSLTACAIECGFTPAKHHEFIISKLESVVHGTIKNLILLVPPGSAKTTYTSRVFVLWFLAQHPGNSILACSYSYTLAERNGKWCRNTIDQKEKVLGYGLSKHSQAAGDWETTTGSIYFAAGVGAGIAGHRADLGLIDDYLGSQEDADSKLIRDKQWDWFHNDYRPRLKPNAATIIIANRRHEDDLVGRLLETEPEKWTVVKLPMLAEENDLLGRAIGERLWPEWYTEDMVKMAKSQPRTWAGLYQQRPAPEEGDYFKKEWLVAQPTDLPKDLRYYIASDHALSLRQENDKTCILVAGVDHLGRIFIMPGWFWGRADTLTVVDKMIDFAKRWKPVTWWTGKDHITKSIGPFLQKRMRETNTFFTVEELTESRDKVTYAQSIRGRMAQKMVLFPKSDPQWADAEHELLTFPNGKFDDLVNTLSNLGRGLDRMLPAELTVTANENFAPRRITMGYIRDCSKQRKRHRQLALQDN